MSSAVTFSVILVSRAQGRNLLGLTGVIDQIRLIFDGTPTPIAKKGVLIVEKL